MGYRSDVAISFSKDTVTKIILENQKVYEELCTWDVKQETANNIYFLDYFIKWYEEYPKVILINEYLDILSEDDFGFLRIGEDYNDYEEKGTPYNFGLEFKRDFYIEE